MLYVWEAEKRTEKKKQVEEQQGPGTVFVPGEKTVNS
jgi:hypothetical protein